MRLNKIILPIALITPLFASSCDKGGKYKDVTLDAYELVYAYSETCSTTITISDGLSDVEFVEDFKKEYFTFDKAEDIQGKSYEIDRTSSKKITITFTKAYSGLALSQTESKEIKYKISKSAFKNNVLTNDATGKMAMVWDSLRVSHQGLGPDSIEFDCEFTTATGGLDSTKVTLDPNMTEIKDKNLTDYCSVQTVTGQITFNKIEASGVTKLKMSLSGLPNDEQAHGYSFNIRNIGDATVFSNIPDSYGVKFDISKEAGTSKDYNLVDSTLYFTKYTAPQII